MSRGRIAPSVSAKSGLPRYVLRVRKGGREYLYFRYRQSLRPLPALSDPAFHASYTMRLVEHGLVETAVQPIPRSVTPRKVYFVEDITAGAIKIGVTRWPKKRLSVLQIGTSNQLRLLATIPGDEHLESDLHARFAAYRRRGEWFDRHPELLAEIERLSA